MLHRCGCGACGAGVGSAVSGVGVVRGGHWSSAPMTVVTETIWVGSGLLGSGVGTSDGVGVLAGGDLGVVVAAAETRHDAALVAGSSGGASTSHCG